MGLIYNNKVPETKIMTAYGLTVYGKVNTYDWTLYNKAENALISVRITDESGNDLIALNLGNVCIFQSRIDDTLDNFLYWIKTENPDMQSMENMIHNCLCQSNSLFNHRIETRKADARRKEQEQILILEREKKKELQLDKLKSYCKENGLLYYIGFNDDVTIIKPMTDHCRQSIADVLKNNDRKRMESYIEFAEKYPKNNDLRIVKRAALDSFVNGIKK